MQERLNRISEEFKAANDLKREIESKEVLTENDKEELAIIEEWLEEFRIQINEWAEEYNKQDSVIEIDEPKEKTLKEQFDENRIKINEIKYESKSLQPKFDSSNKKHKHEVLESLGFIETTTVDNRKIQIHPTLVGQYYDLVKEQKRILEKIKEENKSTAKIEIQNEQIIEMKEEQVSSKEQENKEDELKNKFEKNQQELAKILEGKGLGKKDYIKHNGIKYWIPKKYINRFRALMHEQDLLSKELFKPEEKKLVEKADDNEQEFLKNIEKNIIKELEKLEQKEPEKKQLPMLIGEVNQIKRGNEKLIDKIKQFKNKIMKNLINKIKNTTFYKKYKEYTERKNTVQETKEKIKELNEENSKLKNLLIDVKNRIEYMNNIENRTQDEEEELQNLIELQEQIKKDLSSLKEDKKTLKEEIKNIRKPKTNIKEKLSKNKKKSIMKVAIIAGLGAAAIMLGLKSCNNNQPTNAPIATEKNTDTEKTDDKKEKEKEKENTLDNDYYIDDEQYNITGQIYSNMYDASEEKNSQQPYFGENTEGFIVGWGVNINGEMVFIRRSDADYKEKLEQYLNQGGQVTTYAMSDVNSGKINEITGFYNEEQVSRRSR